VAFGGAAPTFDNYKVISKEGANQATGPPDM